jgi:hypothetical protein
MAMHEKLEALANLSQFHATRTFSCVVHMQTGCTVFMYSADPGEGDDFNLRWPGSQDNLTCRVPSQAYIDLMEAEERQLWPDNE